MTCPSNKNEDFSNKILMAQSFSNENPPPTLLVYFQELFGDWWGTAFSPTPAYIFYIS